jgi:hypothetical protein
MQSHLGFVEGPSLPVRLSAAAGILFQVNAAWLVWQFLKHKAPDVVHFKTPAYYKGLQIGCFQILKVARCSVSSPPLKNQKCDMVDTSFSLPRT